MSEPPKPSRVADLKLPSDVNALVDMFVKTRDRIKAANDAHKERVRPANELLDKLEAALLTKMHALKVNSMKSDAGTVYLSERASATLVDASVFRSFVIDGKHYDLADWRANAPAVRDFIDKNKSTPPGVNFTTALTVGVRRANEGK